MRRVLLITLFLAACTEELEPLPAADASIVSPDLGVADSGVVAVPDAGFAPDAAAVRQLVTRPLFGEMPLDNRVHDPVFDLDSFGWYGVPKSSIADRYPELWAKELPRTPTSQPVLAVPKAPVNVFGVGLIGAVKAYPGAIEASVYIGREEGVEEPIEVSLLGVNASGADVAYDLLPEGEPLLIDGIVWRRHQARIADPAIGWMELWITDGGDRIYYVTAPLVVPAARERRIGPPIDRPARAQSAAERDALRFFAEQQKHRISRPSPPRR